MTETYELLFDGRAIKCLKCGAVSWHPRDIAERYCSACKRFHKEKETDEVSHAD